MTFTSVEFVQFIIFLFLVYWLTPSSHNQNILLLATSYVFYGWVNPWFCILIAASTIIDYICGLGIYYKPNFKRSFFALSLIGNLGILGFFKYFNFFVYNFSVLFNTTPTTLSIILPVGISFYTFQSLSYSIDIYRGNLKPRKNFVDFWLFFCDF